MHFHARTASAPRLSALPTDTRAALLDASLSRQGAIATRSHRALSTSSTRGRPARTPRPARLKVKVRPTICWSSRGPSASPAAAPASSRRKRRARPTSPAGLRDQTYMGVNRAHDHSFRAPQQPRRRPRPQKRPEHLQQLPTRPAGGVGGPAAGIVPRRSRRATATSLALPRGPRLPVAACCSSK